MLLVLSPLAVLLRLVILDIAAEHSHFFMEFGGKVKVIKLSKTQLTIVIIQALL